jgi:hypothetical protein
METVVANRSFSCLLKKGNEYKLIREIGENYVVLDNDGVEVGFNKQWFDSPIEFNAEVFASSIIRLMLFPKSKDFTHDDIVKGKAYSSLVIETVKGNCQNDGELKQVELIKEAIDKIESL